MFENQTNYVSTKRNLAWLDYTIDINPTGVLAILTSHGMVGQYTPENDDDIYEACLDLLESKGVEFKNKLIKEHPDYNMIINSISSKNVNATQDINKIQEKANEIFSDIKNEFNSLKNNINTSGNDELLKYGIFAILGVLIIKSM